MRWIALAGVGLALAGCVEGKVWNVHATRESVPVGNLIYGVSWMRLQNGDIQAIAARDEAIFAYDAMTEKMNSTTAASQVAQRQCLGKPAHLLADDRQGTQFHFRFRCA